MATHEAGRQLDGHAVISPAAKEHALSGPLPKSFALCALSRCHGEAQRAAVIQLDHHASQSEARDDEHAIWRSS